MWNVMTHEYESIQAPPYWSSACGRTALDYSLSLSWGNWQITGADIQWRDLFKPARSGIAEEGWGFGNASCSGNGKRSPAALQRCLGRRIWDGRRGVCELLPVARVCANLPQLSKHKDEALPQAFLHRRYPHSACLPHAEHDWEYTSHGVMGLNPLGFTAATCHATSEAAHLRRNTWTLQHLRSTPKCNTTILSAVPVAPRTDSMECCWGWRTVVAKMIRTLVFSAAKNGFK